MNDYKLINSLLEGGSESSLLKLKMIVKLNTLILRNVAKNNRFKFVILFKEYFDKIFATSPYVIQFFNLDERFEIVKLFENSFYVGFKMYPYLIKYIPKDEGKIVSAMFPEIAFPQYKEVLNFID